MDNNQHQLEYAFGTTSPGLIRFPHVIFRLDGSPLAAIGELAQEEVGIWGERMLATWDGSSYLEPVYGRIVDDFALWELPRNQVYARSFTSKAGCFTMGIPTSTPANVLEASYDLASGTEDYFDYYALIGKIHEVLNGLRWAYIPLVEGDFAMLVVAPPWKWLVDTYRDWLEESNRPVFEITYSEDTARWNGPVLWSWH